MRITLEFICPKRKCRHQFELETNDTVRNADCPNCKAGDLAPIAVRLPELEESHDGIP